LGQRRLHNSLNSRPSCSFTTLNGQFRSKSIDRSELNQSNISFLFLTLSCQHNFLISEECLKIGNNFYKIFLDKIHIPNRNLSKLKTYCSHKHKSSARKNIKSRNDINIPCNTSITS